MLRKEAAAVCAAFFLLTGCACGLSAGTIKRLDSHLVTGGFTHQRLADDDFPLHAWLKPGQPGKPAETLTVVIEGDGASWFNPRWPPADPTPESSQAAALAAGLSGPVVYLARPCQFESSPSCQLPRWTGARFATELVDALDRALERLKQAAAARQLRLVGHSGGGVMAVLLAQRRQDVASVVTLMAPLAISEWVRTQNLTPLQGDDPGALPALRVAAVHVAGGRDAIVPPAVIARYVAEKGGEYLVWPEAEHACWPLDRARRVIEDMP